MNTTENNKLIAEFIKDKYFIDSEGNVYNKSNKKLKTTITKNGYEKLNIGKPTKSYLIHRLVAITFIPNLYNKEEVNHIDGNKLNNKIENLEWVTRSENITHSYENNLRPIKRDNRGIKHWRSIPIIAKDKEGNLIYQFSNSEEASRELGFSSQSIRDAVNGKLKTYKKLSWSVQHYNSAKKDENNNNN